MVLARMTEGPVLRRGDGCWVGAFRAMAGPCEVLVDTDDRRVARRVVAIAAAEARRIERKYSRYLDDSVLSRINRTGDDPDGDGVEVDDETARLLDYAGRLYELSDGRFDVTSGVLRRAWTFDGSDRLPADEAVEAARRRIGWPRVRRDGNRVALEPGMELDFGGLGKEYAVDSAARRIAGAFRSLGVLVNFGGDVAVPVPRRGGRPWRVGIEDADAAADGGTAAGTGGAGGDPSRAVRTLNLVQGGLATSGDARRFLLKDGVRYSHILDPRTGRPVEGAPRSVTVAAGTCTDAGMLATFAMLRGAEAEEFLREQGVRHWVQR